jgi:hypothetical protein
VRTGNLFLGTAAENSHDMLPKGRARGTLPPHGKLTAEDVVEIRRIWAEELAARAGTPQATWLRQTDIGAAYGVSGAMICLIVNGKWWKNGRKSGRRDVPLRGTVAAEAS